MNDHYVINQQHRTHRDFIMFLRPVIYYDTVKSLIVKYHCTPRWVLFLDLDVIVVNPLNKHSKSHLQSYLLFFFHHS
jgi:hypothetical protein